MSGKNQLRSALAALAKALEGLDCMVIGGLAVIHRGFPRLTTDVHAVIPAEKIELGALLERLAAQGLEPRVEDPVGFARKAHLLLLTHQPTSSEVDLALSWLPFEHEAIARASPELILGTKIRVASPENLLIYKAFAGRPKDWEDAERLLVMHSSNIRLKNVKTILRNLFEVLDEPDRMDAFEALVLRCGIA